MAAPTAEHLPADLAEPVRFWVTAQGGTEMAEGERLTKQRLPDPPFLTEEGPPPFDLPRPGPGQLVRSVPGGMRLPDPLLFRDEP